MPASFQPARDKAEAGKAAEAARFAIDCGCRAIADGDPGAALPWFDRAHRLAPGDPTAALLLASALAGGDPQRSESVLMAANLRHPRDRGILTALASGALRRGDVRLAVERLHALLAGGAPPAGATFATLAAAIVDAAGSPGWIGLASSGTVSISGKRVRVSLDGRSLTAQGRVSGGVRTVGLPDGWAKAARLTAVADGIPLTGSPIDIRALLEIEGCVTGTGTGMEGWAWHPNDPDAPVHLALYATGGQEPLAALVAAGQPSDPDAPAQARRFVIDAAMLRQAAGSAGALILRGPDGTPIPGGRIPRVHAGASVPASARAGRVRQQAGGLHVILPLIGERAVMEACLHSLTHGASAGPLVITAASAGRARGDLQLLVREHGGTCLADSTEGISAALNAAFTHGLAGDTASDLLILTEPIPLPPGLAPQLRAALRAAPAAGLAQPVIVGVPHGPSHAKGRAVQPIATVAAPCIAVSSACLRDMARSGASLLQDDLFFGPAAALTDFGMRAGAAGWGAVLACDAYLPEPAPADSSAVQAALAARDQATLLRLHATLPSALADLDAALATARRRAAVTAWEAGRSPGGAIVLVTHADGGGVERFVGERAAMIRAAGRRPIVVRAAEGWPGDGVWTVSDGIGDTHPALSFDAPGELSALAGLLRGDRPAAVEFHHAASHDTSIAGLAACLGIPYDVYVHDFAALCPRVTLMGGSGRYCGEPADVTECDDCVADHGVRIGLPEPVSALRARSAGFLGKARRIIVPAADAARRLQRYFPAIKPEIVPWQDDRVLTAAVPRQPARAHGRHPAEPVKICVAGALGLDKGYEVILACARDASRRALNLTFTIVGHTIDDARLLDTGRVFITGRYQEDEAVALIRAQRADMGFLPSVWPESWCYALSALWQAGLWTLAFALGAPAERIAATGAGRSVPPAMPAPRLNDFMLSLLPAGRVSGAVHHG